MSTNNSQTGHIPSETIINNNDSDTNISQQLLLAIMPASQPSIQFNNTNMIPSQVPTIFNQQREDEIRQRRRESRRRYRQRRAERRRYQREIHSPFTDHRQYWRNLRQQEQPESNRPPNAQPSQSTYRVNTYQRQPYSPRFDYRQFNDTSNDWEQAQVAELEQLEELDLRALFQDEIEQEENIEAIKRIEEERQQEMMETENWDQARLLDFERVPTTQEDELLQDYLEQLKQIDLAERYQEEINRQNDLLDQWNQKRLSDYEKIKTPPQ